MAYVLIQRIGLLLVVEFRGVKYYRQSTLDQPG